MAARKHLAAVTAETAKPKPRPKTLAQAIESGTYLEVLEAQRREMVRDVKDEKGPAKAAMHRQIALLSKEIAALSAADAEEAAENAGPTPDEAFDAEAL